MAAIDDIRQRIKDYLYGTDYLKRPFTDFLNQGSDLTSSTTVITVENINSWAIGDIVEFNTGEQAYIKSVDAGNNRFTVARGWNGTTAAAVTDATPIEKNPKFTLAKIDNAIDSICRELYPEVYTFKTGSGTIDQDSWLYDVSQAGLREVLSVYYPRSGSLGNGEPYVINTWRMNKHMDNTAFGTTIGLQMWAYGELKHGDTFYYTYRKLIEDTTDLQERQYELVVTGSVYKLMGSNVPPSTNDSRDSRQIVQPGQEARDSNWFYREYLRNRKEEHVRLLEEERFIITSRQTRRNRNYRD
jgi:hypothetical protein